MLSVCANIKFMLRTKFPAYYGFWKAARGQDNDHFCTDRVDVKKI